MPKPKMFFPEYLNQGSQGPAVAALQMVLKAMKMDISEPISISGAYKEKTARAVRRLQEFLEVEVDGHFGPGTRAALTDKTGLDVNVITAVVMAGKTKEVRPNTEMVASGVAT